MKLDLYSIRGANYNLNLNERIIKMGKFDGYLICTDLDDTLLTSDKTISDKNIEAIEYFKSEGGTFTFATGRVIQSTRKYIELAKPNAPVISYNGCAIYDWKNEKFIYKAVLDEDVRDVLKSIMSDCEYVGAEVVTENELCICRNNQSMMEHMEIEGAEYVYKNIDEVEYPWIKVIMVQTAEEVELLKKKVASEKYADKYNFVQSASTYYEILPKNVSKGTAGLKLCELLGIDKNKFAAIGDNENDIEMIANAAFGAAVGNAADYVKSHADAVAPHHNDDAIAWLIDEIEKKLI